MVTKLAPERHDLIWGSRDTEPWYPNPAGLRAAEVWFPSGELLIKFLFTADSLSVQVHPNDEQAQQVGKPRGKTEMWHILRADPGARIALGLNRAVTAAQLRSGAVDGSIVDLLNWIPVSAGQTFFVPAGTIHAIGAGIVLCEIQQLSDITYRLYDWSRGRELHLEQGVEVSLLKPANEGHVELPVESTYFRTERVTVNGLLSLAESSANWIVLEGTGTLAGYDFQPGDVFLSDGSLLEIRAEHAVFLKSLELPN